MAAEREIRSFKIFKRQVNRLRLAAMSPDAGMDSYEALDKHETIQNILEAALIDGASHRTFIPKMLRETNCRSLTQLAAEHGRQDSAYLEEN